MAAPQVRRTCASAQSIASSGTTPSKAGSSWAQGCQGPTSEGSERMSTAAAQKITTLLMFEGKAEEAMTFYTSLFEDAEIVSITRFGPGEAGAEGSVQHATFSLAGAAADQPGHPPRPGQVPAGRRQGPSRHGRGGRGPARLCPPGRWWCGRPGTASCRPSMAGGWPNCCPRGGCWRFRTATPSSPKTNPPSWPLPSANSSTPPPSQVPDPCVD